MEHQKGPIPITYMELVGNNRASNGPSELAADLDFGHTELGLPSPLLGLADQSLGCNTVDVVKANKHVRFEEEDSEVSEFSDSMGEEEDPSRLLRLNRKLQAR